jgi:hypothetical protein
MSKPATLAPTHVRLLRERRFPAAILPYILPLLRTEAATGRLILDFSQGSVCAISFQERAENARDANSLDDRRSDRDDQESAVSVLAQQRRVNYKGDTP